MKLDLSGRRFGYWEVIGYGSSGKGGTKWICRCSLCGTEKEVRANTLLSGSSTKCRNCATSLANRTKWHDDPITVVFYGMKNRCYNMNSNCYRNYGARGIGICDEWLNDRTKFYEWAYSHGYEKGLTIERIDVNSSYSPDNCTFIPKSEQSKNRRNTVWITINGKTDNIQGWADFYGLNVDAVRIVKKKHGFTWEEAFIYEANHRRKKRQNNISSAIIGKEGKP